MTIERIRPAHSPDQLAVIYATPHDHRIYGDGHHLRVEATSVLARWAAEKYACGSVADLSCGNGEIATRLGLPRTVLGDYAPGYEYTGPIEDTITKITDVDLFVCSETLEHLDDPAKVLFQIRAKARFLVLSTPIEAWGDSNAEHYYAWDREGVETLFASTSWKPRVFATVDSRVFGEPYLYAIWLCR